MEPCERFLISASDLVKRYGTRTVLNGITLGIREGDFISVTGASGSGKSTLINILGLLDQSYEGEYLFDGENVRSMSPDRCAAFRNRTIGFVFQSYHLIDYLSVEENVLLPAAYAGALPDRSERDRLFEELELTHLVKAKAALLSGGEKQRVAVARAMINHPRMIIADEPTGNLDEQNSDKVFSLFEKLNSQGVTILMVTHSKELAKRTKRTMMLCDGKLKEIE